MPEAWRPVLPPYTGLYEASDLGQIRSLERDVAGRERSQRRVKGKLIKPLTRADGVLAVNLWHQGEYRQFPVRRIVMEAFVSPRPRGYDAININGDLTDNRLENLTWAPDKRRAHFYGVIPLIDRFGK